METYEIFTESDGHEYTLKVDETDKGTVYELSASLAAAWSNHIKGTLLMKVIDDGNGIIFDRSIKTIDYSEAEYIRIIMSMDAKLSANTPEYKVVKSSEPILI